MIYGVGTHVDQWNRDRAVTALKDLGAQSMRDEILWSSSEATAGTFALTSHHQAKLDTWDSVGTDNVAILCYGNSNYSIGQPYTQAERDKFCDYVRFVVPILATRCKFIEIWNEWEIGSGRSAAQTASGQHSGAAEYVALCRDAAPIIKELAPNAVILGLAITNFKAGYIEDACDAGLLQYVDAVSIHSYNYNVTPPTPVNAMSRIEAYQARFVAKNGGKNVDFYITEHGWPTHTRGAGPNVGQLAPTVSTWLARLYRACELTPWIKGVWWYDLWDDGPDQANNEHRFGLMANDGRTPKPAYHVFKALTNRARNDQSGWCRIAVTAAIETEINKIPLETSVLPPRAQRALKDLRSTGTTVTIGARTLRVMTGPIDLAVLDDIGERFADDFIILEGPVVRGQVPAQTTATRTTTWPSGWV